MKAFVLQWGMGSRWDVNRSIREIHAFLYLSHHPLIAAEMCTAPTLARSNISTALRELQSYGLVRLVHKPSDRRDHFIAEDHPWNAAARGDGAQAARDRPTISFLGELNARLSGDTGAPPDLRERVARLLIPAVHAARCDPRSSRSFR